MADSYSDYDERDDRQARQREKKRMKKSHPIDQSPAERDKMDATVRRSKSRRRDENSDDDAMHDEDVVERPLDSEAEEERNDQLMREAADRISRDQQRKAALERTKKARKPETAASPIRDMRKKRKQRDSDRDSDDTPPSSDSESSYEKSRKTGSSYQPRSRASSVKPGVYNPFEKKPTQRRYESDDDRAVEDGDDDGDQDDDRRRTEGPPVASGPSLIKPRAPVTRRAEQRPPLPHFINPNTTLEWYDRKNQLNMHYSVQDPTSQVHIVSKDNFASLKLKATQKFDWTGGQQFDFKMWEPTQTTHMLTIGAFAVVNRQQVFKLGTWSNPIHDGKHANPTLPKTKVKLPLYETAFHSSLSEHDNGQKIDYDTHQYYRSWYQKAWIGFFSGEGKAELQKLWPKRWAALKQVVDNEEKLAREEHKAAREKWEKLSSRQQRNTPEPVDKTRENGYSSTEVIAQKLIAELRNAIGENVLGDTGRLHINFQRPFFRMETKKEQAQSKEGKGNYRPAKLNPDGTPNPLWAMYNTPPDYIDEQGKPKPGYPRRAHPVVMFACVTMEQRRKKVQQKEGGDSPYYQIPPELCFLDDGDIVAPITGPFFYDTTARASFKMALYGCLWLGNLESIDETRMPDPELDPTSYFVLAQPYTRGRNFQPKRASQPAPSVSEEQQKAEAAVLEAVAQSDAEYGDFVSK